MLKQKIDSKFKTFNPKDYLNEYYTHIGKENLNLLKFFAKTYKHVPKNSLMLEFGGGPTIYSLISAANIVKEIHFADLLDKNLNEVKLWRKGLAKAFIWSSFVRTALKIEGAKNIDEKKIKLREKLIRKKLTKFLLCNAFKSSPLGKKYVNFYDIVNVNFVLDSITSSKKIWEELLLNITNLLKKNGTLIMSALKNATYWRSRNKFFPAVNLNEKDIKIIFSKLGLQILSFSSIPAEILDEKSKNYEGYKGMMFISAKKT